MVRWGSSFQSTVTDRKIILTRFHVHRTWSRRRDPIIDNSSIRRAITLQGNIDTTWRTQPGSEDKTDLQNYQTMINNVVSLEVVLEKPWILAQTRLFACFPLVILRGIIVADRDHLYLTWSFKYGTSFRHHKEERNTEEHRTSSVAAQQ